MVVVATGTLGHPVGQRELDAVALVRTQEQRVRQPIAVFDLLDVIVERVYDPARVVIAVLVEVDASLERRHVVLDRSGAFRTGIAGSRCLQRRAAGVR